ncbi:MAG TPA: TonB family protein [Pyrinomonadaceae bacterium]|nr:TonB family protein [Pyrinomonadaceae bacterium]
MRKQIWLYSFLALIIFLIVSVWIHQQTKPLDIGLITIDEMTLRKLAIKKVMPDFPDASKTSGSKGVAVVQLRIDQRGNAAEVEVLQAPDTLTGSAVSNAVKQWAFEPFTANGQAAQVRGKLTFYYKISNCGARVEDPRQVKSSAANPCLPTE